MKQLKITYENTSIKQMIDETARMIEDRYYYPAIFTYEDGQEISVFFPDFDVSTSGVDEKDAFLSARECLVAVIYGYEEDNETLPHPTKLSDMHISDNERTAIIDVLMPTVRTANINKPLNETVTLP